MGGFIKSISAIIVVILIAIIVIAFIGWSRAPDIVANNLSKKMKVSVSIDEINLGLSHIGIEKLEIGNPQGSILSKALTTNSIMIHAPLLNYLNQAIVIDEIDVNDIYLGLEFENITSTNGNWTTIMGNFKAATAAEPASSSAKTVLIKKLVLNNITTDIVYKNQGGQVKRLPNIDHIVLTNISSQGGIPMDQLMSTVLGQMLRQVFEQENIKNMLEGIIQNPPTSVEQLIEQPLKGLFHSRVLSEEEAPDLFHAA